MNFLVLKQVLDLLESLAALGREAVVLVPADPVFDNVWELFDQHVFDGALFLDQLQLRIHIEEALQVDWLLLGALAALLTLQRLVLHLIQTHSFSPTQLELTLVVWSCS